MVVIWISPSAHTYQDPMFFQTVHMVLGCVLNTLIRMMNQTFQIISREISFFTGIPGYIVWEYIDIISSYEKKKCNTYLSKII